MRIGLLSKRFPPDVGGAGSYVLTWAAALSRCGHEVFVITACNPDRSACGVEQSGRLFRLPDFPDFSAGRWSIAALGMKLWPLLDILQADILHAHDLESGWTMALAPAKYRLPPWLMSTHLTPFGSPPRLRVTGWVQSITSDELVLTRYLIGALPFRAFVAHSRYGYSAAATWHVPEERLELVPPAVDLWRFHPGSRAAARRAIGLPQQVPTILVPARIAPRKGLEVALAAVDLLAHRGRRVLVIITAPRLAGDCYAANLTEFAQQMGMGPFLRWADGVPDALMASYYQAADVVLIPSLLEGLGLAAMEAAACGRPTVLTCAGGAGEVVVPNCTAVSVPFGDALATADALDLLLTAPDLAARMGAAARHHAESRLGAHTAVHELEDIYRRYAA